MKNKIILLIAILLILAGTIILFIAGFEKTETYKDAARIEVYIPQGYEKEDIKQLVEECFVGKDYDLEEIEKLNQVAGIRIKDYSNEELDNFKAKISEKYNIEKDKLEIYEIELPKIRIRTAIASYVLPISIITVISIIYMLFRNIKSEDKWKKVLKLILILALVLGVYFSLIVICRLPFGDFTMPLALAIYIVTLIILLNKKQ